MRIILDYWLVRWRSVFFIPNTGIGRVRWFSKKTKSCRGWANKHRGIWFALWNGSSGLVFQAGEKHWNMNAFDCSHRVDGAKCVFEIHKSGEVEYSLEYDAPKDVAFDALDLEMSDYFYWVSQVWNDSNLKTQFVSSWEVVAP